MICQGFRGLRIGSVIRKLGFLGPTLLCVGFYAKATRTCWNPISHFLIRGMQGRPFFESLMPQRLLKIHHDKGIDLAQVSLVTIW